jgi:diacylglycerol kinase family enzyme
MPALPGGDAGACPRRPGVLCNPRSSRVARHSGRLREAAAAFGNGLYREGRNPEEIGGALGELLLAGADIIIVMGGDGTLQAVLDGLCMHPEGPPLAVVPCGSTNMTAMDIGSGQTPGRVLRRLQWRLQARQPLPLVTRPVLRITCGGNAAVHGMFFGAGIITSGVRYFRERVRGRGLTGEAAAGIAALRVLFGMLAGARTGEFTPIRAGVTEDGAPGGAGSFLLLLASTLNRLLLGARPYWGGERAPMHFTAVRDRSPGLWCALPKILAGRGHALEGVDFHSRNLRTLELELAGDFVLDGEIHRPMPQGGKLRVDTAGPVRFVVP